MMDNYILAIDQGTSSTKSIIFDQQGVPVAKGHEPLQTFYLKEGHVEQDPEAIYQNVLASVTLCVDEFRQKGHSTDAIACVGISNQRETFVVWDNNGEPLYNAVVWQCKRSIDICNRLIKKGLNKHIKAVTGLMTDPYFSGTKLIWLYENNPKVKQAITNGTAYFGTVDTWLLFKVTKGKSYCTDHTNASRTMFFNLQTLTWDLELLELFGLKGLNLPAVTSSASDFGQTDFEGLLPKQIAITAMIGDSHAAAFGEGCLEKGQAKATLGTGCSIMMNAGTVLPEQNYGMVNTICWSTPSRLDYALEGVIVSCGATIEWLRGLGIFDDATETYTMATSVSSNNGVYIVPAFSGLGAPYWDMSRKAAIHGLTFDCNRNHIVRAGLETVAFQIRDVTDAMKTAGKLDLRDMAVNGGMISNQFVLNSVADLLGKHLTFGIADASALGAAYLAGLGFGLYQNIEEVKKIAKSKSVVKPNATNLAIQKSYEEWLTYVKS